ncbi:MAG: ABC transporter permease [Bauldia sp.]
MKLRGLSLSRIGAVMAKEFIQMRRDRLTFAMIIGVPIVQLILFGFAINTDPKQLPTMIVAGEQGPIVRGIVTGMQNSGYFDVLSDTASEDEAHAALARGDIAYAVTVPLGFERRIVRGERPQLIVEADATDPSAAAGGVSALPEIVRRAIAAEATGPLARAQPGGLPAELVVHRLYNPEGITRYNIVPGLLGVILTMTTIMMTAMALTREVERGTMENLLAMPARPAEIMIGKIVPYVGFGFLQVGVILTAGEVLFHVPLVGSIGTLLVLTLLFIAANVTLGYTISTVARSQMQAMQMTFFVFLPSILLSGFMFPFRGMPDWAQAIGQAIPLTHYLRIVRGVMLKGTDYADLSDQIWPLAAFLAVVMTVSLLRYRRTLD